MSSPSNGPRGKLLLGQLGRNVDVLSREHKDNMDLPWDVVGDVYQNFYQADYERLSSGRNSVTQFNNSPGNECVRHEGPGEEQRITKLKRLSFDRQLVLSPLVSNGSQMSPFIKGEKSFKFKGRINRSESDDARGTTNTGRKSSKTDVSEFMDSRGTPNKTPIQSHSTARSPFTPMIRSNSKRNLPPIKSKHLPKRQISREDMLLRKQKSLRRFQVTDDAPLMETPESTRHDNISPINRFRRAVTTVMILTKAIMSNRESSKRTERKLLSWTQVHDDLTSLRRGYERFGLTFDPAFFKVNKEVHVSPEAKTTLMLPPSYRTEEQRRVALLSLNSAVEVFSEFPVKMQKSIVKVGWYEFFESKRVIIRQGHLADNFYLILAGTAIVTVLDRDVKTGDVYSRTVALLKKGNSFGEIGLMRGSRRSATVTCRDDMEVLAVGRQDFIDIFMHIEHNKEPNHIQFLRTIDEFHGWPIHQLPYDNPKVCLFTYFRRGVLLCKDSNKSDWIFVIKTGSCRVLKSLKSTKPNLPPLDLGSYMCSLDLSKSLPPLKALNCNSLTASIRNSSWSKQQFNLQSNCNKGNNSLDILKRGPTELENHAEEHLRELDFLLHRKEEDSFNKLNDFPPDHQNKMVFVEIQKLGPRDTYGLESVLFGMMRQTTSTSLVSEGTECILINRKFFLQHLSEDVAKIIRTKIRPLPTDRVLQQKLQTKTNWEAYKALTVADHIIYKQQVQQSLGYG